MKAALIPPIPLLGQFGHGQFHLVLAHLLKRPKYKAHYKNERKHGSYLVLDNSAHEKGLGEDAESLMLRALDVNAQEVVVPDVLWNSDKTIEACLAAHEAWYEGKFNGMKELDPALMYVPQGSELKNWVVCLQDLVRIHTFCAKRYSLRRDFVLGVSKDYEVWDGGILRLIDNFVVPIKRQLETKGIKMHVHLLGWGRDLWKLNTLAQEHPWIRSTDSAKPFVYAQGGIKLKPPTVPEYPKRPRGYFSKEIERVDLCFHNSLMFSKCAAGEL